MNTFTPMFYILLIGAPFGALLTAFAYYYWTDFSRKQ